MIDDVGINGSRVAEGLSAFNVGLVPYAMNTTAGKPAWVVLFLEVFSQVQKKSYQKSI